MQLGPEIAEWVELQRQLSELVRGTGAASAAILDESAHVWCATDTSQALVDAARRFHGAELAGGTGRPHRRGDHVSVVHSASPPDDAYLAQSFAGSYILVVWFAGPFASPLVQARVRRALPRIESLTITLPPPDGPDAGETTGRRRA